MPTPPKTPRYRVRQLLPDAGYSIKRYQLWFKGYKGELCVRPVLARQICRLLNASPTKGQKR